MPFAGIVGNGDKDGSGPSAEARVCERGPLASWPPGQLLGKLHAAQRLLILSPREIRFLSDEMHQGVWSAKRQKEMVNENLGILWEIFSALP